jgi:hypothetical protein
MVFPIIIFIWSCNLPVDTLDGGLYIEIVDSRYTELDKHGFFVAALFWVRRHLR